MNNDIRVIVFDYTSDGVIKITQGNKEELVGPGAPFYQELLDFAISVMALESDNGTGIVIQSVVLTSQLRQWVKQTIAVERISAIVNKWSIR